MSKNWIMVGKHDANLTIREKISQFAHILKKLKEKKDENYYLIIQSEEKIRSLNQNAWWWGVCINQCYQPYIQAGMDIYTRKLLKKACVFSILARKNYIANVEHAIFDKDDIHYRILNDEKFDIWNRDWDKKVKKFDTKTGVYEYQILRNTRALNTVQFTELMERAVACAWRKWEAELPLPEELKNKKEVKK